jgi:hypothetical protein
VEDLMARDWWNAPAIGDTEKAEQYLDELFEIADEEQH